MDSAQFTMARVHDAVFDGVAGELQGQVSHKHSGLTSMKNCSTLQSSSAAAGKMIAASTVTAAGHGVHMLAVAKCSYIS